MAVVYGGVAVPLVEDIAAYHANSPTTPAGFSVDAGPPKKIKATFQAARTYLRPMFGLAGGDSRMWIVMLTQVDLAGTATGNEVVEFATAANTPIGGLYLEWVLQTKTTAKVRLGEKSLLGGRTTLGTSATTYTQGTTVTIRVETNGVRVKVWINGITDSELEIDVAEASGWPTLYLTSPDDADFTHWWWLMGCRGGSSGADRPGVSVEGKLTTPSADYGGSNDYGGETGAGEDCTDAAKGIWSNWDDYGGAVTHDAAVTYNCLDGGSAGEEISNLSTVAVSRTPDGVTTRAIGSASIAAKDVDSDTILKDEDGNQDTEANVNMGGVGWFALVHEWDNPPDGTWADFVNAGTFNHAGAVHQLSVGVQSPDDNTANDEWTAIAVIAGSIDNDPEPGAAFPLVNPPGRLKSLVGGGLAT